MREPFEEYVLLACGVKRYKHGAIWGHRHWKPGGSKIGASKIGETSSLLSDDSATSSSKDMSTTAGCREVTCMRRAYANSLQIGVASVIHPFKPFCSTCGGGLPNTICVSESSGVKPEDAKTGRSSSRVSPWNLAANCCNTFFVAGQ